MRCVPPRPCGSTSAAGGRSLQSLHQDLTFGLESSRHGCVLWCNPRMTTPLRLRRLCPRPGRGSGRVATAAFAALAAWILLLPCMGRAGAEGQAAASDTRPLGSLVTSRFLRVGVSEGRHTLLFLGVDSLGRGKVGRNVLEARDPAAGANPGWSVEAGDRNLRLTWDGSRAPGSAPFV